MNSTSFDTDVLVVGSGPTGATAALALATYGIRVTVVSNWNWTANTPRAHVTNQRAMEVLRDLGVQDEVTRQAAPWETMGDMTFAASLAGREIARLRAWGTGEDRRSDYLQASPCPMVDIPQTRLEPLLVTAAAARGARMLFNTEYLSLEQDADGVVARLRDRVTEREFTIRARYLIGADGARSRIAEQIGLPIEGQLARAGTVYALFDANLERYVAHRPSVLNWIVTSSALFGEIGLGLLRAVEPWTQWIAGWGFDMSTGDPDLSAETVTAKIRTMIGQADCDVSLRSTSVWYVNQAWATSYSVGRVFCGGDAVHRHPPSNGLGSNTGIQDAFNLAWKLAFVIRGHAGAQLLDSYSAERAPIGRQIVARANQSRLDYGPLKEALRVEGELNPVEAGLERLKNPGPDGVAARARLARALDQKNFEFNAHGVELNQRYVSSAVLAEADTEPERWARDSQLYAQATTRPGAKLPHVWLGNAQGRRISTLDVVGHGLLSLVTGPAGAMWVDAANSLANPALRIVIIGSPVAQDLYCHWARCREIAEDGALLVRPDGYVAWRVMSRVTDRSAALEALRAAVENVLSATAT